MPRRPTSTSAPQRSQRGQGRPKTPPAPPVVLGTANSSGTGTMQPTTPAENLSPAAQPAQGADVYNQRASSNIQADLDARNAAAQGGFQSAIAGMDLGGQFSPRPAGPSTSQVFQQTVAANPGVGNSGFVTPTMAVPRPVSIAGNALPTSAFPTLSNTPTQAPSKVDTAVDQASGALGPAPRVDMGLADRRLGEYQEALGMSREVIDRLLNGPSTADRLGSQVLRSQLALARSAAGGPGAVQQAMSQAQQQAPELQAVATQQAVAEDLQRSTAAGNVASNFAQAALGARGQDVNIAGKNVDAGLQVKDMVARLAGTQLELDQRNTELIGQMARDLAALQFDWAQLDAQQASAALDRYLQIYGIDTNYRAQIKALEQQGKISSKDILNGVIGVVGAGATVAATALATPAAGAGVAAATGAAMQATK